jgi:chemotaxis protein histidine kinase CheA
MSDAEIVKEFVVESYENLDRLDQYLVVLEKDPGNRDILADIFRTIHTIKGTSGFLGFNQLEALTHVGESLLARLRDGLLTLSHEITTALLAMVDAVRQMLGSIEATGSEGERNDQKLIATLTRLLEKKASPAPEPVKQGSQQGKLPQNITGGSDSLRGRDAAKTGNIPGNVKQRNASEPRRVGQAPAGEKPAKPTDGTGAAPAQPQVHRQSAADNTIRICEVAEQPNTRDSRDSGETLAEEGTAKPQDAVEAPNAQQPAHGASVSDSTIRVDVGQLDRLMNRVGELVLLRNQIVQYVSSTEDSELQGTSQRLNLLTTELQEGVMKTRMQPIGNIWSKFPRTVRDVALGCGKQVRIEMEGKETELDKTIIEAIKDPLTHLVRNAVDHGIEPPEVRRAAGKNPEGRLFLRAFHEGGQVNIEITDDGAGLDYEKLRSKAIHKRLITADQAERMSEREITNLIFLPGFSTAEKITNVSGRGVGLDVVKTNTEKIGGTVDVQSKPGQGCTVRMKIPLTLAIIPALIVTTGGDRYAIPQVSLLELVRLEGEQARKSVEHVNGAPVYRLRGQLLPLVYLKRELQADGSGSARGDGLPQATSASNAELLDFAQAREGHQRWLDRLRQLLDGKSTLTVEQTGNHKGCLLGKWLYSSGLSEYGDIAEMHVLENVHQHFHELVHRVVTLEAAGQQASAEKEHEAVRTTSARIIELLSVVEKKVAGNQSVNIVVLRADDRQFGLVVDEINDTEEIVVKPLSKQLKSINAYAGATIMGDGRVALILDVLGLAQRAAVVSEARDRAMAGKEEKQSPGAAQVNQCSAVLLFQYGGNRKMAIDLASVARLEEFPCDSVEIAGDREVVQYRGQIMPLIRISEVLENEPRKAAESNQEALHVVVYSDQGRSVGLVVDRILDIVEESFVLQQQTGRRGVMGSAVIQTHVTDILDVPGLIAAVGGSQRLAGAQA